MKLIIDISEEAYKRIQALSNADYFDHDICGNSMRRIANGTPIPDNATNFDVYFALFDIADEKLGVFNRFIEDDSDYPKYNRLSKTWGNAPYQKEGGK